MQLLNVKTYLFLLFAFLLNCFVLYTQKLPVKPTFTEVLSILETDEEVKQSFKNNNIPFSQIKFEQVNPNEYIDSIIYKGKFVRNTISNDRSSILSDALKYHVIAAIPKEIYGASYRIPFDVVFHRLEKNGSKYTHYKEWKYSYTKPSLNYVITPLDVPQITDGKKIEMTVNHIRNNFEIAKATLTANKIGDIIKIESLNVFPRYYSYEKAGGLNHFRWSIGMLVERGQKRLEEATKNIKKEYLIIDFIVALNNGEYQVLNIEKTRILNKKIKDISWENQIDSLNFKTIKLEDPVEYGNFYDNGFDAVYKKYAPKNHLFCSKKHLNESINLFNSNIELSLLDQTRYNDSLALVFQKADKAKIVFNKIINELAEGVKPTNVQIQVLEQDYDYALTDGISHSNCSLGLLLSYEYIKKIETINDKSFLFIKYKKKEIEERNERGSIKIKSDMSCSNNSGFKITNAEIINTN